jgi:hypothetical protein
VEKMELLHNPAKAMTDTYRGANRTTPENCKQGFPDWNRYAIPPSAKTAMKTVGAGMCLIFSTNG